MVLDIAWIRNFDLIHLWTGIWQGSCISSLSQVNNKTFCLDIRKAHNTEVEVNSFDNEHDFTLNIVLPDYKKFQELLVTENALKFEHDFQRTYEIDLEKTLDNSGSPVITGKIIRYKRRLPGDGSVPAGSSWAMKDLSIEAVFENIRVSK